jgi:hypothetical protein
MRTTIDLPEDLHRIARTIARDTSQSMSETVAELMRRGLGETQGTWLERSPVTGLLVIHGGRTITSEDVKALEDDD